MNDGLYGHHQSSTEHVATGVMRRVRDIPPMHYTFEIESFSFLLDSKVETIESGKFEVGDYKWKLSLYPSGNEKDYVSLYLLVETDDLPLNWEVNVEFRFFLFDQIRDKFLTVECEPSGSGDDEKVRRFHRMKTKWGIDKLIPLGSFNDSANGYLVDDHCIFGVEIFIIKGSGKGEILSMQKLTPGSTSYKFKVEKFSTLNKNTYESSDIFTIGGHKWNLELYPMGDAEGNKNISLCLFSTNDSETLPAKNKLCAKYKLRMLDQKNGNHHEKICVNWFESSGSGWRNRNFCAQSDVKDQSKGYLVDDTLHIEVDFIFIYVVKQN